MIKKGFKRDEFGTILAYPDKENSVDDKDVCGVGLFSLDPNDPLNEICRIHDNKYTNPVYQEFHSREEADKDLRIQIENAGRPLTGKVFYYLSKVFGRFFWENKRTR